MKVFKLEVRGGFILVENIFKDCIKVSEYEVEYDSEDDGDRLPIKLSCQNVFILSVAETKVLIKGLQAIISKPKKSKK
jgi:hypothetical protein